MKRPFDYALFLTTLLLVAMGLTMVYSSSAVLAQERYHDSARFLKRELIAAVIGFVGLLAAKRIPLETIRKAVYPLAGLALVLLILPWVPGVGTEVGGTRRWLRLAGFSFQPSEFAKWVLVLLIAHLMAKKKEKVQRFVVGFLPPIALAGLFIALVLAGRDLGSGAVMGVTLFLLLFVGGARPAYLFSQVLLALPAVYFLIANVGYRRQRILAFLDPWSHERGAAFQLIQSYLAFHMGSLFGQGLGEGKQKLFYLPEAHTDFIFSVIGEELGLLGTLTAIVLFGIWLFRVFAIAWRSTDLFQSYWALGLGILMGLEVVFNIGVVVGMLPTKGLPLPFVSYGGTALVMSLVSVGVLLNVSSRVEA